MQQAKSTQTSKKKLNANPRHPSSFRDPSGFIFVEDGIFLRRVNASYFCQYSKLIDSGLYNVLTERALLIEHETVEENAEYKIIRPAQLRLITYPHEWSFSQLKDSALNTLTTHLTALEHGMVLKDASAFNVQLHEGRPIFIDTLSFDMYRDGEPWIAYGQFCRHFLAPLLLMKFVAPDLNKIQISFLDGLPLDAASAMLPAKTHFRLFIKTNIHMHAKAHRKYEGTFETERRASLSLNTHKSMIINMINYVGELELKSETEWGNYYSLTNYSDDGFNFKEEMVVAWVQKHDLKKVWDIGGNDGHFSRLIQDSCDLIVCTDIDPVAVDVNYRTIKKHGEDKIIPLLIDYTNPSPGVGFDNTERAAFISRIRDLQLDCIMALALIHHLSISGNCTFEMLAQSFSQIARHLLIEFIDPADSWADKLLSSKRGARVLFDFYNRQNFEAVFARYFDFIETAAVPRSERTLYLMKRRAG